MIIGKYLFGCHLAVSSIPASCLSASTEDTETDLEFLEQRLKSEFMKSRKYL